MKNTIDDLAIFGGTPAFSTALHVGRPNLGSKERFLQYMDDVFERRWLTNAGPLVRELETQIAGRLGVKHCILICNGTVALEIAIRALDLRGEVIVPSFTFVATAHSLQWQEITPVFCDIDPRTHRIDPNAVEKLITPRTTGIMGVHLWGGPCDTGALEEIARRRNLRLLFDASHAFLCSHGGRMIGNFGDAEVFSFHATKFFNTFEGGAIVTNNDELAAKIRLMKNFGFAGYDNVIYIGTNGKMSEVSAAMGLTMLAGIDQAVEVNKRNIDLYRSELQGVGGLALRTYDESEKSNFQYVVAELDGEIAGITRDALVQVMQKENALVRRYFHPGCHRMEPYRSFFPNAHLLLKETERVSAKILVLPTGTAVNSDEIQQVCHLLKFIISNSSEISKRLPQTQL